MSSSQSTARGRKVNEMLGRLPHPRSRSLGVAFDHVTLLEFQSTSTSPQGLAQVASTGPELLHIMIAVLADMLNVAAHLGRTLPGIGPGDGEGDAAWPAAAASVAIAIMV